MRRLSFLVWALVGLAAGAVGGILGALVGGFWPTIVVAAVGVSVALGLLMRRPRFAVLAGILVGVASAAAYLLGTRLFSPIIAFPVAGLVLAVAVSSIVAGRRRKILLIVLSPVLAFLGFVAGTAAVVLLGTFTEDGRIVTYFIFGGAAGFGLLLLLLFGIVRRRYGLVAEGGAR